MTVHTYQDKVDFFNAQSDSAWASAPYGPEEWIKLERLQKEMGSWSGKTILEPGCGTGRLTKILAGWVGPHGHVTALDISPRMMDQARRRLAGLTNVTLALSALEEYCFQPESFDVVLHHQVFPHYQDQAAALAVSALAVRPGGKVMVFHFINTAQIADTHRQAGSGVEYDLMPPESELRRLFSSAALSVNLVMDDEKGFLLSACRAEGGSL